jgi:cytochrome c peroxidase
MKHPNTLWVGAIALLIAFSCKKQDTDDPNSDPSLVELSIPYYVPEMPLSADNPLTIQGIELGKQLYHDVELSVNGPLEGNACASCHQQSNGFASGLSGAITVMPHANLAWQEYFLWNGSFQGGLEEVMHMEVADFFQSDLTGIKAQERYKSLYKEAFGTEDITVDRTALAMAQYVRSLISFNAPFDQYLRGDETFPNDVYQGFLIYNSEKGDCFHCHTLGLFTDNDFHNNGLDSTHSEFNIGYEAVSGEAADRGKFKTPSLRNVALRPPYMHDGRYQTLREVIEFYDHGVQNSGTLDPIMTKPGKENGLGLSEAEITALIKFLESLTDTSFTENPELAP